MASQNSGVGTSLVHVDDSFADLHVAPAISVTSTYRATEDEIPLSEWDPKNPTAHVYSRYTQNVSTRVEKVIGTLHDGHAITYASGLAATYAALVHLKPKRIAISGGYHGVHATISVYKQSRDVDVPVIGLDDQYQEGDLAWLETPLNPTGEARDIKHYADKIHAVGGKLLVDATFAPPPLQNPFKWGADVIMHSATKYFGGHSDLLSGVLVVKTVEEWQKLWSNRTYLGNTMGSLESWLLLRSLRTLHLRVTRQSETATTLAAWLNQFTTVPAGQTVDGVPGGLVTRVQHASLQDKTVFDPATQLTGGYPATFAIMLAKPEQAKTLPHRLEYWIAATSLGGVESLMEYRIRSDKGADPRLLRLSVGVEDLEDLKADLRKGFNDVASLSAPGAIGPYSQAISAPPFLFLSGCIPLDPATGNVVEGGVEDQTRQALKNLGEVVKAGGSQINKVVKTTVFLKNMDDFQKVNAVYAQFFGEHKPARSAVEVARLPKDVLVEVEAIALV